MAFWSFSRILGYFGQLWCILIILAVLSGSFQTFWCVYLFFDILVILMSEIFFLTEKFPRNHYNGHYTSKSPKYLESTKCPKT